MRLICWIIGHIWIKEMVSDYTKNPVQHRCLYNECERCGDIK